MTHHRQQEQERNQRTYLRSELMAHGEKIRTVEDRLRDVLRRLDALEAEVRQASRAELTKRSSLATIFKTWLLRKR
jgi:hypothetical protein